MRHQLRIAEGGTRRFLGATGGRLSHALIPRYFGSYKGLALSLLAA